MRTSLPIATAAFALLVAPVIAEGGTGPAVECPPGATDRRCASEDAPGTVLTEEGALKDADAGTPAATRATIKVGKIATLDETGRTLTLDDGSRFRISERVSLETIERGDHVVVTYRDEGGERVADLVAEAAMGEEAPGGGRATRGVVRSVDYKHGKMTLADGTIYRLALGVQVDRLLLLKGKDVLIRYRVQDGDRVATSVRPPDGQETGLSIRPHDAEATAGPTGPAEGSGLARR